MTMRKFAKLGSLLTIGALASLATTAAADQINTSGTLCQNFNANQALDIDYLATGVRNINAASRPVVCSIPRSPLPAGVNATFDVDGSNAAGTTTPCTLFIYSFGGTILQTASFNLPGTVAFAGVGTFDYADVLCTLPGNANGVLFGVTSR